MSVENLVKLKKLWGTDSRFSFGREVYDKIVDELLILEGEIATLKEQMANRMLCKNYKEEE